MSMYISKKESYFYPSTSGGILLMWLMLHASTLKTALTRF